jgi:hypothetical protein
MPFKKGEPRPEKAGRKEGSQNKLTVTIKECVLDVFNRLQGEPKVNMFDWAKTEPTEFYKIAAKLIPAEITAKVEGKIITVKTNDSDRYLQDNES